MRAYVHIPFCRRKCGYCKFALTPFVREAEVARYFAALHGEVGAFLNTEAGGPLETLYFGGGTPSAVGALRIAGIIDLFRSRAGIVEGTEITVEANPEDLSAEFCRGILEAGVTRLSVGVQSLDDAVLEKVGRASVSTVFEGLTNAFAAGFRNVGCDFIMGLPGEAPGATAAAIAEIADRFPITHASVYLLEEGKYPAGWQLPAPESVRKDFLAASETLAARGFRHYEISNFAKPGFESRHNLGYWQRRDTRGFGLAAASLWKGERFENAASFSGYYRGETVERERLTDAQILLEEALCGIRTFDLSPSLVANRAKLAEFVAE
jgi:oxygen-independent coproporphyrinogen-3 oxidase